MTQHLSRRAFLPVLTAPRLPVPARRRKAAQPFPQWVEAFRRARAGTRRFGCHLHARDGRARSPTHRCSRHPQSARVQGTSSGNTSTAASPTGASRPARRSPRSTAHFWPGSRRTPACQQLVLLSLWGIESAYGDPDVQKNHMRPVFPSLAALAWGEPRRRNYWEQELINALRIVERGWATPSRNARLLGGRHGPHPVDAGGLAQYRHGL